ncbi:MAG: cyclase family protein, partial [Gammaproteobacteria bacterium]
MPRHYSEGKLDMTILRETAEKCKNWGRWGPDDEAGTLNFITPQDIVAAAALVRRGKVFSLGLNFDKDGPQRSLWGNRFNPIHTMLATGTDAVAGNQDEGRFRYADDMVSLPLQCGTQWDALGHIFFDDKMWNGYDARLVDANGAKKNGIEKVKDRMTGRGVLLDVARHAGIEALDEGMAIT